MSKELIDRLADALRQPDNTASLTQRAELLAEYDEHARSTPVAAEADWVMVPREPTPEMISACYEAMQRGSDGILYPGAYWKAMLAAAPTKDATIDSSPVYTKSIDARESGPKGAEAVIPGSRKDGSRDRPSSEPGGMECETCGCIFIGDESHAECKVCHEAPRAAEELPSAAVDCGNCRECLRDKKVHGFPVASTRMIVCTTCGNKRCPRATDHRNACTNSNEPGQAGSYYAVATPTAPVHAQAVTDAPEIGSRWQHKNGNFYTVLLIANHASERDEYPVMVVYRGDNGNVWSRKLNDWHRSMTLAAPPVELRPIVNPNAACPECDAPCATVWDEDAQDIIHTCPDHSEKPPVELPGKTQAQGWFAYDPIGNDFFTFETTEEAIKCAHESLDYAREQAPEGWPEETDQICWGMICGGVVEHGRRPSVEGDICYPDCAEIVDYALETSLAASLPGATAAADGKLRALVKEWRAQASTIHDELEKAAVLDCADALDAALADQNTSAEGAQNHDR